VLDAPPPSHRGAVLLGVFGGLFLLAASAIGLALYFANTPSDKPSPDKRPSTDQVALDGGDNPRLIDDGPPPDTDKPKDKKDKPKDPPKPPPPPPLAAEEQKRVDKALDTGVAYLKKQQDGASGIWVPQWGNPLGHNALLALTLMECGVKPDDDAVKSAIQYVRSNCPVSMSTYEISLSIMMLDKVGTAADKKLIQSLALRLIHSQQSDAGWTYNSFNPLSEKEETSLLTALKMTRPLSLKDAGLDFDTNPKGEITPADMYAKAQAPLTGNLKQVAALQAPNELAKANNKGQPSDNSNTQFALIALWVAGRNGVPSERSLAVCTQRFRPFQNADGGWGYMPMQGTTNTMTGAGLLSLGVGHGLSIRLGPNKKDGGKVDDAVIQKGMTTLGTFIGDSIGPKSDRPRNRDRNKVNLYYFWTLERVGVLYSATKIGGKNWYQWGAELLVDNQGDDGSWNCANYPGSDPWLDTAFALLFLKRANLVEDLSSKVQFVIDAK
jgi:hypothetical protein